MPYDIKVQFGRGVSKDYAIEACGLLPHFFVNALTHNPESLKRLADLMNDEYGFGGFDEKPTKHKINIDTGVSNYPGDPTSYPILRMAAGRDDLEIYVLYVYKHGFLAIVDMKTEEYKVTRMD